MGLPTSQWLEATPWAGLQPLGAPLVLVMLFALSCCFLGYVIFRVHLLVAAVAWGTLAGAILANHLRNPPTGADYLVLCTAGAALAGLLAWLLYRLTFGAVVGLLAGGGVLLACGLPPSAGEWVLAALAGLIAGGLAFACLRPMIIFATGLFGGLAATFCAAILIADGPDRLRAATIGPEGRAWLAAVLLAGAVALSVTGMLVQAKLLKFVRSALAPAKPRSKGAAGSIHPRLGAR